MKKQGGCFLRPHLGNCHGQSEESTDAHRHSSESWQLSAEDSSQGRSLKGLLHVLATSVAACCETNAECSELSFVKVKILFIFVSVSENSYWCRFFCKSVVV